MQAGILWPVWWLGCWALRFWRILIHMTEIRWNMYIISGVTTQITQMSSLFAPKTNLTRSHQDVTTVVFIQICLWPPFRAFRSFWCQVCWPWGSVDSRVLFWLLRNSLFGTLQGTSISSLKVARKVGYVSSQVGHASSQEGKFPFQHRGGYFGAVETQVRNTGGKPRWEEVEDGEIGRWTLKVLDSHPGNANWECHFQ